MEAATVGDRTAATQAERPAGQGFSRELERAETRRTQAKRPIDAALRKGAGGESALLRGPLPSTRNAPREVLIRRRTEADVKDDRLLDVRNPDCGLHLETERSPTPLQSDVQAELPTAASLAAVVERIELALERQQRAQGPSLEMQFGGRLLIRLTRGGKGLELAVSGDAATPRLAKAELPDLLAKLRQRGITVSRADVRVSSHPPNRERSSGDRLVDGEAGVR